MYFVLTKGIIHPETQEPIIQRGRTVSLKEFQKLSAEYGVDYVECYACTTEAAAKTLVRWVLEDC